MQKFLILLLLFQMNLCSYAQWEQAGGPIGNVSIKNIFRHDSFDYASVAGCGLFKRHISENTWTYVSENHFKKHILIGDDLYVNLVTRGGYSLGLQYIDLKNGVEFSEEILPYNYQFPYDLKFIEHSETHLYVGVNGVIFQMDFDGSNRIEITSDIPEDEMWGPDHKIRSFALTNDLLLCGTREGVFISSIDDIDWINSSNGLKEGLVSDIKSYDGNLYCVIESTLYESSDNGQQWSEVFSAPSEIISFHVNSNERYVITEQNGMWLSENEGSWIPFMDGSTNKILDIAEFDSALYLIFDVNGLHTIENEALIDQNAGFFCASISSMATDEDFLYVSSGHIIAAHAPSNQWQDIAPTNLPFDYATKIISTDETVFTSIRQSVEGVPFSGISTIFYSTDQGGTWNEIINPVPESGDDTYRIVANEERLYASEDGFLYFTEDFGINWTQIELPEEYGNTIDRLEIHNSHLYIAPGKKGILKLDTNDEWIDVGQKLPNGQVKFIMFLDQYIFAEVFGEGLFRSLIDQDEWVNLFPYPNDYDWFTDYVNVDSVMFISTWDGVLYSKDYGETLVEYNENLINRFCRSIEYVHDTLYVGTGGNSVWKQYVDLDKITSTDNQLSTKTSITIFPNPASDWLYIQMDNSEVLQVSIFDIFGNKVNRVKIESGELDIRDLHSGIYFFQIEHENGFIVEKVFVSR